MADLSTDVRYVKGIGEQRAKALNRLGIFTLRDLIAWFPRRYEDRTQTRRIADLTEGETACVAAMVAAPPTVTHIRKGMDLTKPGYPSSFSQAKPISSAARPRALTSGAKCFRPSWSRRAAGRPQAASCPSTR